jgi:type IV pilus assembly protein PilY1
MTHKEITRRLGAAAVIGLMTVLWISTSARAQSMADYTAAPPFIVNTVPPNVLLVMDNSGSMNTAAYKDNTFDPAIVYYGYFDPYECYTYGSNRFFPNPAANPAAPGTCESAYPWSGNLLNYASMRRIDIVKWVMMGGTCSAGGRDAYDNCKQLVGQYTFDNGACCRDTTTSVPTSLAMGRIPSAQLHPGSTIYFHLMGSIGTLKGGFCVDDDATQPTNSCSDGDGYDETLWQINVQLLENASGIIQQVGNRARFGLMEFKKGSADGGKVLSDVGSNPQDILTAIENTTPATWTPLAEALYEATRYFAQIPPAYAASDYSYNATNRDPYYFRQPNWADTSQYVPCCKSFVILFTDGQPTQDTNIPSGLRDYAHTAASHPPAGFTGHCTGPGGCTGVHANSPHINHGGGLTNHNTQSDHHDNCSKYYGGINGDGTVNVNNDACQYNGSHYLDDIAYYAHKNDLRQAQLPVLNETGKDLPGLQNLTIYTFYAFGTGGTLLQAAAKVGGFDDRNNNDLPDLPEEYDRVNNYTGAAGPDGIPDTYFESSDAFKLKERLLAAITSILQKSASGTSVSVLATSSTGDGSLYQAFFYPTTFEGLNEIKWTGYTQALFLDPFGNIREDTNGDGRLVLSQDYIVKTRYDTATADVKVDRYKDLDGNGVADTTTPFETVGLKEVKNIWEAGKRLALKDASARNILTWVDKNGNGTVDSTEQMAFSTTNGSWIGPYLRATSDPWTVNNIINFIRGEQIPGLRNRQLNVASGGTPLLKVWKLGDPVHSTPTIVGPPRENYDLIYGDASYTGFFLQYKNRRQVAYVGANDGMLHAINNGYYHKGDDPSTSSVTEHGWFTRTPTDNGSGPQLGDELWGFIPYQLLPHLLWLTRPDYTHVYYVDLKPKVADVRIFTPDADHPNGWGTILIGGFRLGGSCGACAAGTGAPPMQVTADFGTGTQTRTFYTAYFALDITNPETDPVLLWSFSIPDLGLSTSYPAIVRVNPGVSGMTDNTQAKWMMLVGSGPTGYDGISTQTGQVFAVDLKTGPVDPATGQPVYAAFPTADANSFMGNTVALDINLDFRTEVVYIGNTINNGSSPTWAGKLYRLTTHAGDPVTTAWGVASGSNRVPTLLLGSFPTGGTNKVGPVTVQPTVTLDDSNKIWVYFGTGRFWAVADKTNTDTQYFFGVKDYVLTGGCTEVSVTSCEFKNLLDVSSVTVCVECSSGTNQVTGVSGVTTFSGTATTTLQGLVQSMDGWFTTLPTPGERVVSSPTLIGGIVYFVSFIPSTDICSGSGTGNLYALFYQTGSAYKESVVGTTTAGGNTNVNRSISLGTAGLASQMAVHIGAQGTGANGTTSNTGCSGRVTGFIQSSTGTLSQFCTTPALNPWSRYISWLNQRE